MKRTIPYILIALFLTSATVLACGEMAEKKVESSSLGLQAAKRVVRTKLAEERIPARAYGWSYWMVQKYKKSARYQVDSEKTTSPN